MEQFLNFAYPQNSGDFAYRQDVGDFVFRYSNVFYTEELVIFIIPLESPGKMTMH